MALRDGQQLLIGLNTQITERSDTLLHVRHQGHQLLAAPHVLHQNRLKYLMDQIIIIFQFEACNFCQRLKIILNINYNLEYRSVTCWGECWLSRSLRR